MGFFKKFFLGSIALGFILLGGSGTQSSNILLQGGGFVGLIIGLVALYLFTKMAWRAMGCLPSFLVIMGIVCFIIYAIGGFNNGIGGVLENLRTFIGGNSTIAAPQISFDNTKNSEVKLGENFSDSSDSSQSAEKQPQNKKDGNLNKRQTQPQQQSSGMLGDFINNLTGANRPVEQFDINDLPSFTSAVSVKKADTFNAQGYIVKLYGVAAPDLDQTCANKNGASYNCGQQAALWLQSWITNNPVTCKVMSQNKDGNMVAACTLGQYDIGAALVNAGWAVADPRETDIYLPYEQNAQSKGNGLWQGKFYKPWDWQAIKKRKPQYKIIQPKDPNRRSFFK